MTQVWNLYLPPPQKKPPLTLDTDLVVVGGLLLHLHFRQWTAHVFPPAPANPHFFSYLLLWSSFSSVFIFFACTPCFSFRDPYPDLPYGSPLNKVWSVWKQLRVLNRPVCTWAPLSSGCCLAERSWDPAVESKGGFQKKPGAGHTPHQFILISFFYLIIRNGEQWSMRTALRFVSLELHTIWQDKTNHKKNRQKLIDV